MKQFYTQVTGGGKFAYLTPEVTILEIRTEAGFAQSSTDPNEGMGEDNEQNPW